METKNKNKKKAIMLAVIGIAIVCICVIGVFAKKAYDRHQEELRLQAIETKNSEIDEEYQRFEKGEDRDKKLEALKQEMESAEKYKKTEGAYKECSVHYEKIIAQMKNSFVSEYDDTIKIIADKIGDDVEKVDDKEALKNAISHSDKLLPMPCHTGHIPALQLHPISFCHDPVLLPHQIRYHIKS